MRFWGTLFLLLLARSPLQAQESATSFGAKIAPQVNIPAMMKSDRVNLLGFDGQGITVAVIDTGFNYPGVTLLAWHDLAEGSAEPCDRGKSRDGSWKNFGHGTMVVGCVRLTAPRANLVVVRYSGSQRSAAEGVRHVLKHYREWNVRVINLSMAGGNNTDLIAAVKEAISQGIVVVAPIGNNGPKPDEGACPANIPEVLTVGAARDPKTVSIFSSRGPKPGSGEVQKPDLCAPGERIPTWMTPGNHFHQYTTEIANCRALNDNELIDFLLKNPSYCERWEIAKEVFTRPDRATVIRSMIPDWYKIDDYHLLADGTSNAGPLVAGVVATLIQSCPQATPFQIKEALTSTATPMSPEFGPEAAGTGFIDAQAALEYLKKIHAKPK